MSVAIINRTIREMCEEVKAQGRNYIDWKLLTEEELLYEVAVCIFGSQLVFEMAVAMADRLREEGLLRPASICVGNAAYEAFALEALSVPVPICDKEGAVRWFMPRFKNRLSALLATTLFEIYGNSLSIRTMLAAARNAKEAREVLIRRIWGFGPKQASLFLRRIGYCSDLAVLDVHVLDYLQLAKGIHFKPSKLGRLPFYEEIEDTFRNVAAEFGYSLGCVDLATWLTMRVAKREAYL